MPTAPLYDSTSAALAARLPAAAPSQIETLARVLVGIAVSGSSAQGAMARAMPRETDQASKQQRIRRLRDTPRLDPAIHFPPVVKDARRGLTGQRGSLLRDRGVLSHGPNALVVSAS